MASYQLNILHSGENTRHQIQSAQQTLRIQVENNTQYQLVDGQGNLISADSIYRVEKVGNDLLIYLEEGLTDPTLILEDYALHNPVYNTASLTAHNTTFATVSDGILVYQPVLASEVVTATTAATASATLSAATTFAVTAATTLITTATIGQIIDDVDSGVEEASSEEQSSEEQSSEEQSSEELSSEEQLSEEQSSEEQSSEEQSSEEQSSEEPSSEEQLSEEQSSEEQSSEEQSSEEQSSEEQSSEEKSSEEQDSDEKATVESEEDSLSEEQSSEEQDSDEELHSNEESEEESSEEQSSEEPSSEEQLSEEQLSEEQSSEEQSSEEQSSEEQSSEEQSSEEQSSGEQSSEEQDSDEELHSNEESEEESSEEQSSEEPSSEEQSSEEQSSGEQSSEEQDSDEELHSNEESEEESSEEQSSEEPSSEEQLSEEQSSEEQSSEEQSSEDQSSEEQSSEEQSSEEQSSEEQSSEEQSSEEQSLEEQSSGEQSSEEPSSEEQLSEEQSSEEQSSEEQSSEEQSSEEQSSEEPSSEEQSSEEQSSEELSSEEQLSEEQSSEEQSSEEQSSEEQSSEEKSSEEQDSDEKATVESEEDSLSEEQSSEEQSSEEQSSEEQSSEEQSSEEQSSEEQSSEEKSSEEQDSDEKATVESEEDSLSEEQSSEEQSSEEQSSEEQSSEEQSSEEQSSEEPSSEEQLSEEHSSEEQSSEEQSSEEQLSEEQSSEEQSSEEQSSEEQSSEEQSSEEPSSEEQLSEEQSSEEQSSEEQSSEEQSSEEKSSEEQDSDEKATVESEEDSLSEEQSSEEQDSDEELHSNEESEEESSEEESSEEKLEDPEITINPITGDDIIQYVESKQDKTTISGSVSNAAVSSAKAGDTVTIKVGETENSGVLKDDGNGGLVFDVEVGTLALINHAADGISVSILNTTKSHDYQVDLSRDLSISLDTIAGDDIINKAESESELTISGKVNNADTDDKVDIWCACAACGEGWKKLASNVALNTDGSFSMKINGVELINGISHTPTIKAILASDENINASRDYNVDTELSKPTTTLLIAGDNKINTLTESGDVAVNGKLSNIDEDVTSVKVTVTIDGKEHIATVSDDKTSWTLTQNGTTLANLADKEVSVKVAVEDKAGNTEESDVEKQAYTVSNTMETPVIFVDAITGDDIVNTAERDAGLTITGRVENGIAGQTMQVGYIVKGWNYVWRDTVINDDLTFSYTFSAEDTQIALDDNNRWDTRTFYRFPAAVRYTADYGDGQTVAATMNTNNNNLIYREDKNKEGGYMRLFFNMADREPDLKLELDPIGIDGSGLLNAEMQKEGTVKLTGYFHSGSNGHSAAYADKAISASVTLGGETYTGTITGNTLYNGNSNPKIAVEFEVPFTAMQAILSEENSGSITLDAVVSDGYGNLKNIQSDTETYTIDLTPPDLQVEISPISQDTMINLAESREELTVSGKLTYDKTDVEAGTVEVIVTFDGVEYTAEVDEENQTWSYTFPANPNNALAAAEGNFELSVKATASDQAGNLAETSAKAEFSVDLTVPEIEITLNPIGTDGVVNKTETAEKSTVSGVVKGEFNTGDTVTLTVNGKTYTAEIADEKGNFSAQVDTSDLIANEIPSVQAVVETKDAAGNPASAQTSQPYDVVNGDIKIEITAVAGVDHLINVTEAKETTTIVSGKISGSAATKDSVVTISVNGTDVQATLNDDLTFTATVQTKALLENKGYLVKGSATGLDEASASTAQSYTVSPDALASVDITDINNGFIVNEELGGMVTITGEVAFNGLFAIGMNASAVSSFQVMIGDKSYTASMKSDRKTFEIKLPENELAALDGGNISFDFGVTSNVYLPTKDDRGYWFARRNNSPVTYDSVTLTSDYVVENGDGTYSVQVPEARTSEISGTVSGLAKAGDVVEVELGGKTYQAKVEANNTFKLTVPTALLAENESKAVTAKLITQDLAGNEIEVSDTEAYLTPVSVSGEHVQSLHEDVAVANRKYNHLDQENPEEYNYPYFMEMFRGAGFGYNSYSRVPFGGSNDAVIKYHFVTAHEANEVYKLDYGKSLGTHIDLDDGLKNALNRIFAKFDEYLNVKFEYSEDYIEDGSGINITNGKHTNTGASAFAVQGMWLLFNGHGAGGQVWGDTSWSQYISIHELTHNFGFNHTALYFTDAYRDSTFGGMGAGSIEDTTLLSYMSYNYGDKTGLAVTGYDLAALHYRYGVNPNSRAGDDVYTFQNFADAESFGGVYIWDGGGVDTFDASNEKEGVYVNLKPGSWIYRGTQEKMLTIKSATKYNAVEWFEGYNGITKDDQALETDTRVVREFVEGQAFIGFGTQIENAIGTDFADTLIGNEADNNLLGGKGNDTLKGGKGNDYLDGGEGADEMHGGEGDDTFVVDNVNDKVIELEDEGTDTVISFIDYKLGDNLENLTLMGTVAKNGTGNELDNIITANNAGNTLNGGAGNDRLIGGLGEDTLTGGEGNDTFVFNTALNGKVDTITDFAAGDKIELSKAIFTAIDSVESVMTYIQYDTATGKLSYQESSAVDAIHFATLENLAKISANDFVLA